MKATAIYEKLWDQYSTENPSAGQIHRLFSKEDRPVINDHVAFRTFNDARVNIDILALPFIDARYEPKGEYRFEAKKLLARIREKLDRISEGVLASPDLIFREPSSIH